MSGGLKLPRRPLGCLCALLAAAWLGAERASAAEGRLEPPRPEVFELALRAYDCGRAEGAVQRPVLAVIDYTLPSTEERLWLIDPRSRRVRHRTLVAHGRESGELRATRFSNAVGSYRSSLGLFVTGELYTGQHGRSLRLHGLEPGVNDAAFDRALVVHAAWYATRAHAARFGRLGRSHGCPALAPEVAPALLRALQDGAALFAYGDDPRWLARWQGSRCGAIPLQLQAPLPTSDSSVASRASSP
jgi:hypothetical protein